MAIEAVAAAAPPVTPPAAQAGYGASLSDIGATPATAGNFDAAMARAASSASAAPAAAPRPADMADAIGPAMKGLFNALNRVNGEAKQVGDFANNAMSQGRDMTPGEIVQLTMRCHEFMFHCQLSSSIANRTSDGLQQLFRQQS